MDLKSLTKEKGSIMRKAVISGTGLFVPPHKIDNDELVATFNLFVDRFNAENAVAIEKGEMAPLEYSSTEFIEKASGIKQRYVMEKSGILDPARMCPKLPQRADDQPSLQCEMAVAASREALDQAGKTAADIDLVIVACSNMQRAYPSVAVEVQHALGIEGYAYDMNIACSSATFGMHASADAIKSGSASTVLLINPEICTGHLDFCDRDCHFIFGDVCTATVIETAETVSTNKGFEIIGTRLKTSFSNSIRNNSGFLNRCEVGGGGRDKLFMQQGRKVFKEVVPMVAQMITDHLRVEGMTSESVQRLWLHQANLNMNQLIARKVYGRDTDTGEAPVILDEFANTSSAGSIVASHKHRHDLQKGDYGVICSFGAGYSVGSVLVRKN